MTVRVSSKGAAGDSEARQWGSAGKAEAGRSSQIIRLVPAASVEIPPDGYPLVITWNLVRGATSVVVDDGGAGSVARPPAGSVRISPAAVASPLGDINLTRSGDSHVYANPQHKRIIKLILRGFKRPGNGNPVYTGTGDLDSALPDTVAKRLIVSTRASGNDAWMPVFAVPHIGARNAMPAMLTGASFGSEILTFPYALTGQIQLILRSRDALEDASSFDSAFSSVGAVEEVLPRDLELSGPTGQVIWSFPGDYLAGSPSSEPSLRVPVELALNADLPAALAANRPLRAEFKLTGTADGEAAFITFEPPRGAVLREQKGLLHCDLTADPVPIPLGDALDAETPQSVKGGFSVRYQGLRLLGDLSDPLPAPSEAVRGAVVGSTAVLRTLPPQGLAGVDVAKVGFIGRAPEECELEAQLIRVAGTGTGQPVGSPGRMVVSPANAITTVWIDLPAADPVAEPLAISLRALRGRFFWAGAEQPMIRIVVRDPDPGGRLLRLGPTTLMPVDTPSIDVVEQIFPASLFHGTIPAFESELFLSVDISDLILRYRRP